MILPCLLVAACAMRNPAPPTRPATWVAPEPTVADAQPLAANTGAGTPDPQDPAAKPADAGSATPAGANAGAANAGGASAGRAVATGVNVPAADAPSTDLVVATVAGKPIYASELMAQWLYAGRSEARDLLDNLVIGRLVVAEATRLGVRIDPELAEKSYTRGVEALEKQVQSSRKSLENITLDRYVDQYLGLDPKRYRERLRDDSLRSLLGERVVRAWLLQNEHAFLRVVVVKSEEDKKLVEDGLAAGTPFEELAKQYSKDLSAKDGGRIAPIVRGKTPIASVAFATEPGKVGGPIAEGGDFLFVRVEKRGMPLEGAWNVLGPAVETSIGDQGVDQLELEQWRRAMRDRYTIDYTPFLRLAGESAPAPRTPAAGG